MLQCIMIINNYCALFVQVNRSPSFHTDAPLDKEVKEGLLHDTFQLLDLFSNSKKRCQEQEKKKAQDRLLCGKKSKENRFDRWWHVDNGIVILSSAGHSAVVRRRGITSSVTEDEVIELIIAQLYLSESLLLTGRSSAHEEEEETSTDTLHTS